MATLTVFMLLIVPAVLILLAALLMPSKERIESDPSLAYGRGRRSAVGFVGLIGLIFGLILIGLGGTQNVEAVAGSVNAIQLGGAELVVLAILLLVGSSFYQRRIRRAKRGEDEVVMDVQAIGTTYLDESGVAIHEEPVYYDAPPPYRPPRREPQERIPPPYGPPRREPPERSPPAYGPPRREPPERSPPSGRPPYEGPPRRRPPQDF